LLEFHSFSLKRITNESDEAANFLAACVQMSQVQTDTPTPMTLT
jgi:hypothetical protein